MAATWHLPPPRTPSVVLRLWWCPGCSWWHYSQYLALQEPSPDTGELIVNSRTGSVTMAEYHEYGPENLIHSALREAQEEGQETQEPLFP